MFVKLLSVLVLTNLCLLCNTVNAQESAFKNKQVEYIDVKCHVVLTSGKPMISLWRVDTNQLASIKQWIIGKKVTTPDSTKPSIVYKAFSCIAGNADFTEPKAKKLDEITAR
jgi:hypothetical protein